MQEAFVLVHVCDGWLHMPVFRFVHPARLGDPITLYGTCHSAPPHYYTEVARQLAALRREHRAFVWEAGSRGKSKVPTDLFGQHHADLAACAVLAHCLERESVVEAQYFGYVPQTRWLVPDLAAGDVWDDLPLDEQQLLFGRLARLDTTRTALRVAAHERGDRAILEYCLAVRHVYEQMAGQPIGPLRTQSRRDQLFADHLLGRAGAHGAVGVFGASHLSGVGALLTRSGYLQTETAWLPCLPPSERLRALLP